MPKSAHILVNHLRRALQVSADNVIVVGSAKIGFSLSPDTFPRAFSEQSDIDVLVVDERLFDSVWYTLLKWNYPRRAALFGEDWEWTKRRRNDLYWGWFVPNRIRFSGLSLPSFLKPVRDFSTLWFNTFRALTRYPEFAKRDVSGRLYRTWDHARLYHADGLRQLRDTLTQQQKGARQQ